MVQAIFSIPITYLLTFLFKFTYDEVKFAEIAPDDIAADYLDYFLVDHAIQFLYRKPINTYNHINTHIQHINSYITHINSHRTPINNYKTPKTNI